MTAGVISRVETALGGKLESKPCIHNVRLVAPNKRMLCVCFQLPAAIAFEDADDDARDKSALQEGLEDGVRNHGALGDDVCENGHCEDGHCDDGVASKRQRISSNGNS